MFFNFLRWRFRQIVCEAKITRDHEVGKSLGKKISQLPDIDCLIGAGHKNSKHLILATVTRYRDNGGFCNRRKGQ